MNPPQDHSEGMATALRAAALGLGASSPNPAVGAAIYRNETVLAVGGHRRAGLPHAEREALTACGDARGATLYVTLEPCCHSGRQPPCTQAVIEAGLARVVIGSADPDRRVDGGGVATLRAAGIEVVEGVAMADCDALNPGYLHRQRTGRPRVLLKTATTTEGAMATHTGHSQWITGPEARRRVHELRARVAGIMVGGGTARADAPHLNVRLDPTPSWRRAEHQPTRIVASISGEVAPPEGPGGETLLLGPNPVHGFDHHIAPGAGWSETLRRLAEFGINELLVEGGARLAGQLLAEGLVDEWLQMVAPMSVGGAGLQAVAGSGVDRLDQARRGRLARVERLGDDACLWTVFDDQPSFADQDAMLMRLFGA